MTESLRVKNFLEYQKETSLIYFDLHIKLLSRLSTLKVNEKDEIAVFQFITDHKAD